MDRKDSQFFEVTTRGYATYLVQALHPRHACMILQHYAGIDEGEITEISVRRFKHIILITGDLDNAAETPNQPTAESCDPQIEYETSAGSAPSSDEDGGSRNDARQEDVQH